MVPRGGKRPNQRSAARAGAARSSRPWGVRDRARSSLTREKPTASGPGARSALSKVESFMALGFYRRLAVVNFQLELRIDFCQPLQCPTTTGNYRIPLL